MAAKLNTAITRFQAQNGTLESAVKNYDDQMGVIDKSIERLTSRFSAAQQSLVEQFTRLETNISKFQSLGSLIGAQLGSIPRIGS